MSHIANHGKEWIYDMTGVKGSLQPAFFGLDYSTCWIEETDNFQTLFDMQNSLYEKKDSWWNPRGNQQDGVEVDAAIHGC